MALSVVILAAGLGKRMHSQLPKVLHALAGKTLLEQVVKTTREFNNTTQPIVVYGHQGDKVRHTLAHLDVKWVEQKEQLGTGHALQQALPQIPNNHRVLVLYGDVPLIAAATLKKLLSATPEHALGMITAQLTNPLGYGRIIRDNQNKIINIIEEKDTSDTERLIHEINSGIYLVPVNYLQRWLPNLDNNNIQKEYYLTDMIRFAVAENIPIHNIEPQHVEEVFGVNDRVQLAELERFYQREYAKKLMQKGVTLFDPARFDVRGELKIGQDVVIDVNVIIEGNVTIGSHCVIGPNVVLRNVTIGDFVEIKANSVIDGAEIHNECLVGPFARIRPGTILLEKVHVGNFAEIKNSVIGTASKVHHVSYLGDTEIGKHVNIGAGTITCNYDGENKYRTIIGDYAFIGSNTELVAPVSVGENAVIGAGSTITKNAPAGQLTLARAKQCTIENWQRRKKKEKES